MSPRTFAVITRSLQMSEPAPSMPALDSEDEDVLRATATSRQRRRRSQLSVDHADALREADSTARAAARSQLPAECVDALREADSTARAAARSQLPAERADALRGANSAAHDAARSQLPAGLADEIRDTNTASRRNARDTARAVAAENAARIERSLINSVKFTSEQLDFAFNNFERSPAAALSFITANTGIANTPADLGPLLDGVPDVVTERCVAAFMQATDLSLYHGCACCGMRTSDCSSVNVRQLQPYIMSAAETETFNLQPIELRQVQSTCLIGDSRYRLHPELVDAVAGCAWRCATCTDAKDHVHARSVRAGCDFGSLARIQPPLPRGSIGGSIIARHWGGGLMKWELRLLSQ